MIQRLGFKQVVGDKAREYRRSTLREVCVVIEDARGVPDVGCCIEAFDIPFSAGFEEGVVGMLYSPGMRIDGEEVRLPSRGVGELQWEVRQLPPTARMRYSWDSPGKSPRIPAALIVSLEGKLMP